MMSNRVYTVDAETRTGAFCFSNAIVSQLDSCGQSAPCVLDLRPASSQQRWQVHGGRFVFSLTFGELIDHEDYSDIPYHFSLYVIRQGDTIFYVGQSKGNVITRLWQHIGPPMGYMCGDHTPFDDIGRFVAANMPQAREWQIDLLSLEDCDNYLVFSIPHGDLDEAESSLIRLMAPCLNRSYNHSAMTGRLDGYVLPWKVSVDQWPEM